MKNLGLFVTLIALLGFVYLTVEKTERQEEVDAKIFNFDNLGKVTSFRGVNFYLKTENGKEFFLPSGEKADERKVGEVFKMLEKIKVLRVIEVESDEGFFEKDPPYFLFKFKKGEAKFSIGKKIKVDRSFYFRLNKLNKTQIVIAHDVSPLEGIYFKEQAKNTDLFYKKIITISLLKNSFFRDYRIFTPKERGISSVQVESRRNRAFKVNFDKDSIVPKLKKRDISKIDLFKVKFSNLEALKIIDNFNFKNLRDELSSAKVSLKTKRGLVLRLFAQYNEKKGFFLLKENKLYELDKVMSEVFFYNYSDFSAEDKS